MNAKFDRESADMTTIKQGLAAQDAKLLDAIKDRELKAEKQHRELKAQIAEVKDQLCAWSNHTVFQRVLFELQVYKRTELDDRFIERVLRAKLSD